MLRPKQWSMFWLGLMGLMLAINGMVFPLHDESQWEHWLRLAWFLYAAVFFYRAYRPTKPA